MNDLFTNTIELIKSSKNMYLSEAATTSLVNGILYYCGWNVFDPSEVVPQFSFNDKRPDLAIKLFEKRKIYIEIKKYQKKLNENNLKQLEGYLKETPDVKLGFLTNSHTWEFYTSITDENNEIKIIKRDQINILKDSDFNVLNFFSKNLSKNKMVDKWYQNNIEILNNYNIHMHQKNAAIYNLRKMQDRRVIEDLERIFYEEKDDITRLNALNGLIDLRDKKDPKSLLETALDDNSTIIKQKAKENLELIIKQEVQL